MKMLYHPKRILGFEPYVAPEGFDRKAQPVDIYDVFERYYRNHRDAKWIVSIADSISPIGSYLADEVVTIGGTSYRYSYELSGVKYTIDLSFGQVTLVGSYPAGDYDTITVTSTEGYPDTGKVLLGYTSHGRYFSGRSFTYTSKDATHFYGTSQTLSAIPANYCNYIIKFPTGTTKRWLITNNTATSPMQCAINGQTGPVWLYCGNIISSIQTGDSGALGASVKWIHIHKLDNITNYYYCAHYGAPLEGTLHLSRGVVGFTNPFADPEPYPYRGNIAFPCSGITGHLTIPKEFKNVRPSMFSGVRITSLTIEDGIENIGDSAFTQNTYNTSALIIPDSCKRIGSQSFYNNNKVTSLDLGDGVEIIGNSAFQGNVLMAGITLPDSLTTIGTLAFYGCTSFSGTLTIPANITSIGQGAFGDDNFTDIDVTANAGYEDVDDVLYEVSTRTALHSVKSDTGTITFQTNTLIIGDYCCLRNQRTGTLTVPDSVTRVGVYAFYDCDGFTALDLETTTSALATIDDYAFASQSNLAGTITIPNSVTLIDGNAFRDLPKITGLSFGTGLITIGAAAFYNLPLVTSLTLPSNLVTIGQSAFENMIALAGNIVIPNSVETIAAFAFRNDYTVAGTLTLGTGLKTIGVRAFGAVPFTGTLTIPSAVTVIGEGAFYNNNFSAISSSATGFTVSDYVLYDETASGQIKAHTSARGYAGTLTFKAGTTSILSLCIHNNDNRTGAIVIPYTVTSIGEQAFQSCSGFNSTVTIGDATNGSQLTSIGQYGFEACPNITGWYIYRTPAPTCNSSFSAYAKPLHVKSGATGYDVTPATNAAPWTNTAIFSSVTADL